MPNHYLVVGVGARSWKDDESDPILASELNGKNLCEIIAPLPEVFADIVSAGVPCRYIHKETSKSHPSVNGPHANLEDYVRCDLTDDERASLTFVYGADNWYDWQRLHWGTKWGTYDLVARTIDSDGSPVVIEFQCAWCPPKPSMMARINEYLAEQFQIVNITWVGHDPCDGTTKLIESECRQTRETRAT